MQGALLADGDPAIRVLAEFAASEPIPGRTALVVDEGGRAIADALTARGTDVVSWRRCAVGAQPGRAFPPDGPFDLAVLRLPRGRETQAMLGHWLAGRLSPTGELWVAGKNDEGIRSAGPTLEAAFGAVSSREARRHCRILAARSPRPEARADPAPWMQIDRIGGISWASWPGSFAHRRLDEGTALLIDVLPSLAASGDPFSRTLDLGCGIGFLGAAVAALRPGAAITGIDADALALEAARVNVPGMSLRCLDASIALGPGTWTAIVTNPPVHQGSAFDRALTERVLTRAVEALERPGLIAVVALRSVPVATMLGPKLASLEIAAENPRFRVWVGRR